MVTKSVIVPYTPAQMYSLVSDIAHYPDYLPWCPKTVIKDHVIRDQSEMKVVASVYIEYLKIKTHFTTQNTYVLDKSINMYLVDGPFKELVGTWLFTPLGADGCKIDFNLQYKFSNIVLEKLIGPVFEYVSKNIVDCFVKQAKKQYGK